MSRSERLALIEWEDSELALAIQAERPGQPLHKSAVVLASGSSVERDVLMAREGFSKASTVAFGVLTLVLLATLPLGGSKVQTQPGAHTQLALGTTIALAVLTLGLTKVFHRGFAFYNRLKINNALFLFLALRQKDALKKKGQTT